MKYITNTKFSFLFWSCLIFLPTISLGQVKDKKDDKNFPLVEQMPEFGEGGNTYKNVMKYIKENLKYPQEAFDNKIEGTVPVKFVVENDGSIGQVLVLEDPGYGMAEEAIILMKGMPLWKPGRQKGQPIRVWLSVPIVFKLKKIDN